MKKILIIDDDAEVGKLLKVKFEATNRFSVMVAPDGARGLALAQTEKPDLVLCDIEMPGMDGGEVANALTQQEATKEIPVIFLSSLVSSGEDMMGAKSGRWPLVSKQMPLTNLIAKIDNMLLP